VSTVSTAGTEATDRTEATVPTGPMDRTVLEDRLGRKGAQVPEDREVSLAQPVRTGNLDPVVYAGCAGRAGRAGRSVRSAALASRCRRSASTSANPSTRTCSSPSAQPFRSEMINQPKE
jgi:hypothetical protein